MGSVNVIDYLQSIGWGDQYERRCGLDSEIANMAYFCQNYGVSALVISAINRQSYRKGVSLESLKETGNIECCADQVIGLQLTDSINLRQWKTRKKSKAAVLEAEILKNRWGNMGDKITYRYYPAYSYLKEPKKNEDRDSEKYLEI